MFDCIVVGIGGFIGAVCRYLIGLIPVNEEFTFPIKTFCINVIGCFLTVSYTHLDVYKRQML